MYTSKETYIEFITQYIARNLYHRNLTDIFLFVS